MRELRAQLAGALLLVLTAALIVAAVLNFRQLSSVRVPEDGVTWTDRVDQKGVTRVTAIAIQPSGAGDKAGIRLGDQLVQIAGTPIQRALDVPRVLWGLPLLTETRYSLRRDGIVFFKDHIYLTAADHSSAVYYQYLVGIAYLAIGLFVYYRRTNSPHSLHFFLLCLASFVASCFHYSGKLNTFDDLVYWGNIAASLLAPTIFLHFCLTFPETPALWKPFTRRLLIYLPAFLLCSLVVVVAAGWVRSFVPLLEVRWFLDRLMLGFSFALYACGVIALNRDYRRADDPIIRRQLKYLRNGAFCGLFPFTVMYVIPYVLGVIPSHVMELSVVSLTLIPLTWAYAVTRYRLMDVDIIFQQGYVYTLATLAVIGTFYGLNFLIFNPATISPPAIVVLILFATFVFQPIRRWIQEQLDRYFFYRDRYDSRRTLIEFAKELSTETDLDRMLTAVSDRLLRTLSIQQMAFFIADESTGELRLHSEAQKSGGNLKRNAVPLDLSFLEHARNAPYLFFERPRYLRDIVSQSLPDSVKQTIGQLDLTLYVACRTRNRTIAWFGVSQTTQGDFLSRDDVELLSTLAGYVAIAVENTRLYRSLQRKADEYERLKEFSENIVESISVGILAVDLDDRVESWNPQIERLTGLSREEALGRRIHDLFPAELALKFDELRGKDGIHNIYKFVLPKAKDRESVVNLAVAPLISKDLKRIGRLIIFDDITDRDELERRLMQADKLSSIGLLAAGVAHEVNTPLAVISTYAQILTKQVTDDDPKAKMLEKIAKQTFRASEIVNSLLNFSRTAPTEHTEVDLDRVIKETMSLIEHQLLKGRVAIELSLSDSGTLIRGNASKMQQVFLNLFLNARDAMPDGGTLAIRTWTDRGFSHVEIADTGQGIAPDYLRRIYDPFFTTKGAKKGTGLGLSITYGIVQEHNGMIEVDSAVGKGTRFLLEFPVYDSSSGSTAPARESVTA